MLVKATTITISHEYYHTDTLIPGVTETIDERINDGILFDWAEEMHRNIVCTEIVEEESKQ